MHLCVAHHLNRSRSRRALAHTHAHDQPSKGLLGTGTWGTNQWTQVEVAMVEIIWSEPRAPRAPWRTVVTPRNPSKEGKRGGGARTHRGPVSCGGSRRRRRYLLLLSRPPSPFPAAVSPGRRRHFSLSTTRNTTRNTRVGSWTRIPEDES
jgi:hypothetical protein